MFQILFVVVLSVAASAAATTPACDEKGPAIANPAAVYCRTLGYTNRIDEDLLGGQRGVCVFPDQTECDEWLFLEGKCGASYSYCALQGWDLIVKTDGNNPFTRDYAVCKSREAEVEMGAVTDLMDLVTHELIVPPPPAPGGPPASAGITPMDVPDSFDWRNNGGDWMTPVKNQGYCGSCWAFSAVGAVEAVLNIYVGDPGHDPNLAEQQLVSNDSPCCGRCGDCDGGWPNRALDYIRDTGVVDEGCSPYQADDETCSLCGNWQNRRTRIDKWEAISSNQGVIKETIVDEGPLSVALKMEGTFDGDDVYRCDPDGPYANHAVVIAGYDDPGGYWIVKNSWGDTWHGDGYFKVGYGECRIEDYVRSPQMTPEVSCGDVITEDYTMKNSLHDCPGHGLEIGADNITLDCAGYIIDGDEEGMDAGVFLNGRTGVTIKNCDIRQFHWGILIDGGSGNEIKGNTFKFNEHGAWLQNASSNNDIWGNEFSDNTQENAYEDSTSSGNHWDDGSTGNYWDDHVPGHPGWPAWYLISGYGGGIDHHPAGGSLLMNWEGTSKVLLADFPPGILTGGGVAVINGSDGAIPAHLSRLRLAASRGQISGTFTRFVTDPKDIANEVAALVFDGVEALTGTWGGISGGAASTSVGGGILPVAGIVKLCLFSTACTDYRRLVLTQPTTVNGVSGTGTKGVGVGGLLATGVSGMRISLQAAPWTIKAATVIDQITTPPSGTNREFVTWIAKGWAHAPVSTTSSTAQPSGMIQLIAPNQVVTNLPYGSNVKLGSFVITTIRFIPEPGLLLLLGSAVAGLALLGRGKLMK